MKLCFISSLHPPCQTYAHSDCQTVVLVRYQEKIYSVSIDKSTCIKIVLERLKHYLDTDQVEFKDEVF